MGCCRAVGVANFSDVRNCSTFSGALCSVNQEVPGSESSSPSESSSSESEAGTSSDSDSCFSFCFLEERWDSDLS